MNEALRHYYLTQLGIEPLVEASLNTQPLPELCFIGEQQGTDELKFLQAVSTFMQRELVDISQTKTPWQKAIAISEPHCRLIHLAKEADDACVGDERYVHLNASLSEVMRNATLKKQLFLRLSE